MQRLIHRITQKLTSTTSKLKVMALTPCFNYKLIKCHGYDSMQDLHVTQLFQTTARSAKIHTLLEVFQTPPSPSWVKINVDGSTV